MNKFIKSALLILGASALMFSLNSCRESTIASYNLSRDSDNFTIFRRVVFFNGITDKYILSIQGYCSIHKDNQDNQLEVICRDRGLYKKHFLGISDNVTYFVEQLQPSKVSETHYKVIFRPLTIIPDVSMKY